MVCSLPPRSSPHSRLITPTTTWHTAAPSLKFFLASDMAAIPLSLLPTFTGMCLVTDLFLDGQWPAPTQSHVAIVDETSLAQERVLTWRPAVGGPMAAQGPARSPKSTPLTMVVSNDESGRDGVRRRRRGRSDLPPCGVWEALRVAFHYCCCRGGEVLQYDGPNYNTPLTWCLLLCHLSTQLSPEKLGTLRWQDLSAGKCCEGDSRERHWVGLRGVVQYVLTCLPAWHSPTILRLFKCEGEHEGVVRYSHTLWKCFLNMQQIVPIRVDRRVVLFVVPGGVEVVEASKKWNDITKILPPGYEFHVISTIHVDFEKESVTFCLPGGHGLDQDQVFAFLWFSNSPTMFPIAILGDCEETYITPWSDCGAEKGTTGFVTDKESAAVVRGAAEGELQLVALCEFEEHYEATVGVPRHREVSMDVRWPAGQDATWQVHLKLDSDVIPLTFAHPVVSLSHKRSAASGSGVVLCTFEKVASWPLTTSEIAFRTVAIDKLDRWRVDEGGSEGLSTALDRQFISQEMLKLEGLVPEFTHPHGSVAHQYLQLRMSIKSLIGTHYCDPKVEYVVEPEGEKGVFLWIIAKVGLRRDKMGRPLVELVFDSRREGRSASDAHSDIVCCAPVLLHQLLIRNHSFTEASDWQLGTMRANPIYKPSFVVSLDSGGADALGGWPSDSFMRELVLRGII